MKGILKMSEIKKIGQVFKQARLLQDVSQDYVAFELGYKNGNAITRIETSYRIPSPAQARRIGDFFKIEPRLIYECLVEEEKKRIAQEMRLCG